MRYNKIFKKKKRLIPFVVVGDPDYKRSLEIVKTLVEAGADVLELGFAFSDPIADGITIQKADTRALKSGANTDKNFNFIRRIREFTDIPIGLLVYSNLVYRRGIDKFYSDAAKAGVDSVLVADLPIEEADLFIKSARKNKIDTVFIVSPLTDDKRLKEIVLKTKGFVYVVSRLGVTGARKNIGDNTLNLLKRIRPKTKLPLCVGFGISKPEHVKAVCNAGADGVVVGSAIVKIIEKNLKKRKKMLYKISKYVGDMKNATKNNFR